MKKRTDEKTSALRRAAEQRASSEHGAASLSTADAAALVHELQVHQIELEMQNEELQRARSEAEASRARMADLYDFAPIGYFTIARDSTVLETNLMGARLLGVERAGVVSRRLAAFFEERDRSAFDRALTAALASRRQQECGATLARGATFLQMTIVVPPGSDELRVVALDATERKRSEDLVRTSQKLEAIGQLAGGVAHDFNNLLTVIVSNCALALGTVAAEAPAHVFLTDLAAAAERATALTRQLLAFSRKQVVTPRVVDLNALVRDAAAMIRRLISEKIEVVLSLAVDLGAVELDPMQLDQVILNLAVNARDAMPAGGRLTIATSNLAGREGDSSSPGRSAATPSHVRLTVSDTGTGMDAPTMDHIFEPFFTTKAIGEGTGLGLSTVFGIVKACGGDITVRSALGEGTTFDLIFPCVRASVARTPSTHRANDASPKGTETILVIEDEPALLRVAVRVLESAGYTVLAASGRDEALALCERHAGEIHLALSDIMMAGMSSVDFGERMRSLHPETTTLFMSGYTADVIAPSDSPGGRAFEMLAKPFTPDALRRKVRHVLDMPRDSSVAPK